MTNVLVVVVRYYGGVKLGVGGLIHAYKLATEDALSKTSLILMDVVEKFSLFYPYDETQEVLRLINDYDITVIKQEYSETCVLKGEVKLSEQKDFLRKITLLQALGHKITYQ